MSRSWWITSAHSTSQTQQKKVRFSFCSSVSRSHRARVLLICKGRENHMHLQEQRGRAWEIILCWLGLQNSTESAAIQTAPCGWENPHVGWRTEDATRTGKHLDRPLTKNAADHLNQSLPPSPFLSPFPVLWWTLNQAFKQQSETKVVGFFCREWEPFKRVSKMVMTCKKDNQ